MTGELPVMSVEWTSGSTPRSITASVLSVEVEDSDRLVDKATIVLRDPHVSTPPALRLGDQLKVTLGWASQHAVIFEGQIVNTPAHAPADGAPTQTIIAYDLSYLMNQDPQDRPHTGKLSSIVQTIAHPYTKLHANPANIVCDPDPEFTSSPQLLQTGLTDLQFLQWLAWRYGHRAFVEYNGDKSQFYFLSNHRLQSGDPQGVLQWCHGLRQLTEFRYERVASRAVRQRVANVPHPTTGASTAASGPQATPVQPVEPSTRHAATLGRLDPAERARYEAGAAATPETQPAAPVPVPGLPSDPQLAAAVTTWDPTAALGLRGTGIAVGTIMLRAKGKVTIEGIAPWAEGDWYVNKAVHSWRDTTVAGQERSASYQTGFTVTR